MIQKCTNPFLAILAAFRGEWEGLELSFRKENVRMKVGSSVTNAKHLQYYLYTNDVFQ